MSTHINLSISYLEFLGSRVGIKHLGGHTFSIKWSGVKDSFIVIELLLLILLLVISVSTFWSVFQCISLLKAGRNKEDYIGFLFTSSAHCDTLLSLHVGWFRTWIVKTVKVFLQALQQEKATIFLTHFNETAAASTITVSPHADSIVMISIVKRRKMPEFSRHYC